MGLSDEPLVAIDNVMSETYSVVRDSLRALEERWIRLILEQEGGNNGNLPANQACIDSDGRYLVHLYFDNADPQ